VESGQVFEEAWNVQDPFFDERKKEAICRRPEKKTKRSRLIGQKHKQLEQIRQKHKQLEQIIHKYAE
jgi:hypothetical protein